MWTSIVLVSAVTLFVPRNGVSGYLVCPEGEFHDQSGQGLTGCKACSTCQEGRKVKSECQNNQDTVCCPYCASDMYLEESTCVCRPCTRNCPPGFTKQKHCDEYNDAVCVRSKTRQTDRTPAEKTDQTLPYVSQRETTLVINPDSDATLTAGLPLTTVGKYQTSQPHQTTSKHVLTHSVSSSRATGQPLGEAEVKSTAGVTSRHLSLPLLIVTVVLGVILGVVTVASLLLCCKLTMTCHWKRQTTRCVGVAHDHQWRMQFPLNADRFLDAVDSPDRSIRRKGPSPEARSGIGDPDSNSIGSFGSSTSMSIDGEKLANRIPEWECEPVPVVWKFSAAPAAGIASEGRGDKPSFRQRPSMSMVNVYPEMSPSPSKVWVEENGQSDVFHGHYVNEGVHCCHHHHHPECEQRQVCYHTPCVHDDYFQSTLSIGSLGSGCAV